MALLEQSLSRYTRKIDFSGWTEQEAKIMKLATQTQLLVTRVKKVRHSILHVTPNKNQVTFCKFWPFENHDKMLESPETYGFKC